MFILDLTSSCKQLADFSIYKEYLRHSLKDFFKWRRLENMPLTHDEIAMALKYALKAYKMTKGKFLSYSDNEVIGVSLKLEDVYVTLEGEIKFDPLVKKLPKYLFEFGVECGKIATNLCQE